MTIQPNQTPPVSAINQAGYRLDENGVRDRFWKRYFGFWKFAQSAHLERFHRQGTPWFKLIIVFEGRKKPVKIELGSGFKTSIKIVKMLRFIEARSTNIRINGYDARNLIQRFDKYHKLDTDDTSDETEKSLAKAELLLASLEFKKARKETSPLFLFGGATEEQARLVTLRAWLGENDDIEIKTAYEELIQAFPNNEEARLIWIIHQLSSRNASAESQANDFFKKSPNIEHLTDLRLHLAGYQIGMKRYNDALTIINTIQNTPDLISEDQQDAATALKNEADRRRSDKGYEKKQTVTKPLLFRLLSYFILLVIAIAILWAPIKFTPQLYREITSLKKLETEGVFASSERFHPEYTSLNNYNRVRLNYSFSISDSHNSSAGLSLIDYQFGHAIVMKPEARSILKNPESYSIVYLPRNPDINTIHPIRTSTYWAIILEYAVIYLMLGVIVSVIMYLGIRNYIKRRRYKSIRSRRL